MTIVGTIKVNGAISVSVHSNFYFASGDLYLILEWRWIAAAGLGGRGEGEGESVRAVGAGAGGDAFEIDGRRRQGTGGGIRYGGLGAAEQGSIERRIAINVKIAGRPFQFDGATQAVGGRNGQAQGRAAAGGGRGQDRHDHARTFLILLGDGG